MPLVCHTSTRCALLLTLLLAAPVRAQICTDPIVSVLDQFDADDFACSEVVGTLFISDNGSGSLTNLSGLSELTSVGGDLLIQDNAALGSLAGLDNLSTVGGTFEIGSGIFGGNDALLSLTGLEGLNSIGGDLMIRDNDVLASLAGLENVATFGGDLIRLEGNASLISLTGLEGLSAFDGSIRIRENASLASLAGLDNLTSVRFLELVSNPALGSVDGLESLVSAGSSDGGLTLFNNASLVSLAGLASLASVYTFDITSNSALPSLTGLENLTSVRSLRIQGSPALASLTALGSLTTITEFLVVAGTAVASLEGLEGVTSVGDTTSFGVSVSIGGNPLLTSLMGLENLTFAQGLRIGDNPLLTSLAELANLTAIGFGGLQVGDDTGDDGEIEPQGGPVSLTGLEGVTTVAGPVTVFSTAALESLAGLDNLTSIGGGVSLIGNRVLTSLSALETLSSVGQSLFVTSNPVLLSLDGLENVTSVDLNLGVFNNDALSDCACGLGGLISGDPPMFTGVGGTVEINTNDPGGQCTSPEVVLAAEASCVPVASEPSADVPEAFALKVPYPNPFHAGSGAMRVPFHVAEAADVRVTVYDVLGREVAVLVDGAYAAGSYEAAWPEATSLPSGTYTLRLEAGAFRQTQRLTIVR